MRSSRSVIGQARQQRAAGLTLPPLALRPREPASARRHVLFSLHRSLTLYHINFNVILGVRYHKATAMLEERRALKPRHRAQKQEAREHHQEQRAAEAEAAFQHHAAVRIDDETLHELAREDAGGADR